MVTNEARGAGVGDILFELLLAILLHLLLDELVVVLPVLLLLEVHALCVLAHLLNVGLGRNVLARAPYEAPECGLDPADGYSQSWPPKMLKIADPELRRIALLPKAGRSPLDPTDLRHNHRAEYFGEGILAALVSDFLRTEFIEYSEDDLFVSSLLKNLERRLGCGLQDNVIVFVSTNPRYVYANNRQCDRLF